MLTDHTGISPVCTQHFFPSKNCYYPLFFVPSDQSFFSLSKTRQGPLNIMFKNLWEKQLINCSLLFSLIESVTSKNNLFTHRWNTISQRKSFIDSFSLAIFRVNQRWQPLRETNYFLNYKQFIIFVLKIIFTNFATFLFDLNLWILFSKEAGFFPTCLSVHPSLSVLSILRLLPSSKIFYFLK